ATWRAQSWVSALASGPAISRASVSTSSDNAGLEQTGRLSAWRREFLAARARPSAVFGPVLACAFARLALILWSLVKPRFFLGLASSRSLQIRRPQFLARSVAAFRRGPPDAARSRAGWRCDGPRRWWLGDRSARYCRGAWRVCRPRGRLCSRRLG